MQTHALLSTHLSPSGTVQSKLPCNRAGFQPTSRRLLFFQSSTSTKIVLVLFLESFGWSSHSSSNCSLAAVLGLSVWHQLCLLCLCCYWRNMLNKKAKSNQGENAMLPPWGLCHLYFADNGEKSNENKWVVLCCRSLRLEGIWPTNDNNTSWNGLYWN